VRQFLNWVGVIVRNVIAQDAKHRKAVRRDRDREVPDSKVFPFLILGMTTEQKADRDELAIRLTVALEKLPQVRRDVLRARFFDGLSFEENSQQTGKKAGALRVLTFRANTVEIGASPSLMLPWVCYAPRQHGGCDSHASRTMFVSGR